MIQTPPANDTEDSPLFHNIRWQRLVIIVVLLMLAISMLSQNYSQNVILPRYCESQPETLQILGKILNNPKPAGKEARRPYIIAAKLIFLIPQQSGETNSAYLWRIENILRSKCS